ncbi:hypothetical protein M3231_10395 [Neobacillus mesonae]|nr:hypothetical protein [Neobacillus mesonae]
MKKRIYMVLLLIILFFVYWNWLDRPRSYSNEVLVNEIARTEGEERISIADLTDFEWEELYIFRPYSDPSSVSIKNMNKVPESIKYSDSFTLLVFVLDDKVVKYMELLRSAGDFSEELNQRAIKKDKAVFIKDKNTGYLELEE